MGRFLAEPAHDDAKPIHRWLQGSRGRLVYSTGGKFDTEIYRGAQKKLSEYVRAGTAKLIPESVFRDDAHRLRTGGKLRSNDAHVLALARAGRARLLYTGDDNLKADFKDAAIIASPRGKIYSGAKNSRLLSATACPR